jgi:peptidyl-prolyl cis-trans isomerase B (cyclophilin B)
MRYITYTLALLLTVTLVKAEDKKVTGPIVEITTDYGVMHLQLFDATPKHRDNFLKLAGEGFFDSLLFHRVIENFMIQGGDPQSKNAAPGIPLGNGDVGYTIPAEFVDSLFHQKGALCAARTENPEKASSGCQFYIVQGKKATDQELDNIERNINQGSKSQQLFQQIINRPENSALKEKFVGFQQGNQRDSLNALITNVIQPMITSELKPFKYSAAQREIYKTIGGTPFLDQNYTVYGQVIDGFEVIDKIAAVQKGQADRPVTDTRMKVKILDNKEGAKKKEKK